MQRYFHPAFMQKSRCCGLVLSAMALATGHRSPWRIAPSSSCGIGPALAEVNVNPCWSPSMFPGSRLEWAIPAAHIFITGSRTQKSGRRAASTAYSAQRTRIIASPNPSLATCSKSSGRAFMAETLFNSIPRRGGGVTAIHGGKLRGEAEVEAQRETTHEARNMRPASRNLGRRAAMLFGGSTLAGLGRCWLCEEAASGEEWDYGGPSGPAVWTGMCTSGSKQSPVDITSSNTKAGGSLGALNFSYRPSIVSVQNTGHGSIQVNFAKANNFLRVRGQTLRLLQFHFHAPSEHAFDGVRYPMEAHLVHRDPISSRFAVVGVMLDASSNASPNKCLAAGLALVPQEHGLSADAPIKVSPSFLLPPIGSRGYVHYGGSLTTPPCSEGVEWFVLDTPVKINSSQVLDFIRFCGDGRSLAFNSRPLQPLGKRTINKGQ